MSDFKYGYDIRDNVMRLSLIKSATMPDTEADQGAHRFTYALFPHEGSWRNSVGAEAAILDHPVRLTGGTALSPPVTCDAPNVVLETLKPADHGSGFVLRFFESHRKKGPIKLRLRDTPVSVHLCDLTEQPISELPVRDGVVTIDLRPFQIVSILVKA